MKFGLQFGLQLPRPWADGAEATLFSEALAQMELADRAGFDHAWAVEQHFLEEYSHSSAPEVLLAAASQRTTRIRLGHGIVLMPPAYNHPVRVAERIATLDLVSGGRVDFGIGDSKSRIELEGFGIPAEERRAMTMEAIEQVADMLALEPYPGHTGPHVTVPPRNIVPKPVQRPHPPLWMACSDEASVQACARLGVGALTHGFYDPDEARRVVAEYYETFKRECTPIGHTVNPAVAMLSPFHCDRDAAVAAERGAEAFGFLTYAVRHYYTYGRHIPGHTDIWARSQTVRDELGGPLPVRGSHAVGTPAELAERLRAYEEAGVDQAVFVHQAGRLTHEEITGSLQLFADEVLPEFRARERERARKRRAALAPFAEQALRRREKRSASPVQSVEAYGRTRPDVDPEAAPPEVRAQLRDFARMKRLAMRLDE
ncbi:LLM class flavin-dependent oxidoreductase [Amycolatopsis sp. GM8]|uniref:LLM class flavin-dependent oxidoreductase n=1 Tax=Amycolatopsis sp. GM8 TaxID=2896530 RepID=UPI001F2E55DC|nr:LLM class flavin-dependent oxidoreductase [Amycolatopsis sp. GM8]